MDPAISKKPTSIWPGDALLAYLQGLGPRRRNEGLSQVVDGLAARYAYITRASLPTWSLDEWALVLDVLKDHDLRNVQNLRVMGMLIQAVAEQRRASSHPVTVSTEFAYNAKRLNEAQQAAVAETVEGYRRRFGTPARDQLKIWLQEMAAPGFERAAESLEGKGDGTPH